MIKTSDLIQKELVKTLIFSTVSKNREVSAPVIIDGRQYIKLGTLQAVTFIGNVYKVRNIKTEMYEYWLFVGMSKQNPTDINCNKQLATEIAAEHALCDPFMIMQVGKSFGQYTFNDMMSAYVQDMDLEFVKTSQEIKNSKE